MLYIFLKEFYDISSRVVRLVPMMLLFFFCGAAAQIERRAPHC